MVDIGVPCGNMNGGAPVSSGLTVRVSDPVDVTLILHGLIPDLVVVPN